MVIVLALMILAATTVQAGTINPALQARLDKMTADEPISVIVHMTEQANISELDAALHNSRATRQVRHREVVHALQQAAQSQEPLLNELSGRKRVGGVIGFKSYWISNLLVVYAAKAEIERIASRPDVDVVELNFEPELIAPVSDGHDSPVPTEADATRGIGVTPGLRAINAPQVWYELGFKGEGRLIGSCDTGVDGNHPALADRWRGNFHPWQECWLDVVGTTSDFPSDYNDHGTHTTGTMCGMAPDDTVGVAWEAQWIACNPIDQGVSPDFDNDIITVYEWFADPDGDPYTVDDVPDVIQNSWRIHEGFTGDYVDCDTRWWAVIDNCEAMGVVTIWSAGNEGPSAHTIGSPPDRATTPTNCFSVGAVDATNYSWPFPIASFSSRGPSGCDAPPENLIKPEVVAPGYEVYSSVPGGGFEQYLWNGTSMSGPHVAGTVALMRQANPDLEVEAIKLILLETAIDMGAAGEDNTFGWGFIDAYAAVLSAMEGFGQVAGHVTNRSYSNAPIPGAQVELQGSSYRYTTAEDGSYIGYAAPGTYTARASAPGFASRELPIEVFSDQVTTADFSLVDIAGPAISEVSEPIMTTDTTGPYPITARVIDYSSVAEVKLVYRINGDVWQEAVMTLDGDVYAADLPGSPAHSRLEYYIWAQDGIGLTSVLPAGAPAELYTLIITEVMYGYAVEDPEDPDWQLGVPSDLAEFGLWVRGDPIGVYYPSGDAWTTPEDDHTPDPGVQCFVTGNSTTDYSADDVDGGCTTLVSPVFDLSGVDVAFVRYWRYYYEGGFSIDDEFAVDVSSDGGGTWIPLERVPDVQNSWQEVALDLSDFILLTDQVVFRFLACDLNDGGLVEACIDDFALEFAIQPTVDVPDTDAPDRPAFSLTQNHPNPFNPTTKISFTLPEAQSVQLSVYTVNGRKVATLLSEDLPAGTHAVIWDGRNDRGQKVASGSYFYKIEAGPYSLTKRMMLVK
jgi:subtilisin family serine protease